MKSKLKPCPFCGGKAEIETNNWSNFCWVECTECEAKTRSIVADISYSANDKAIELWNQRAGDVDTCKIEVIKHEM